MHDAVSLFGMQIDPLTMDEAAARLLEWVDAGRFDCRYVVTPNVDHVVMYQEHAGLQEAYADASLVVADGFPVVVAARWLGVDIPERVAGSDLVPALFTAAAARGALRVFLLGAGPGVGERAAEKIHQRWPHVQVVGTDSPPLGFEKREDENRRIVERVNETRPDVLVVGLGAPKQELWVHQHRSSISASVVLCAGATIDFLAGEKSRAPRWMQSAGLEWLHRVGTEPRRLLRRYLKDAWRFPRIVLRECSQRSRRSAEHPVSTGHTAETSRVARIGREV